MNAETPYDDGFAVGQTGHGKPSDCPCQLADERMEWSHGFEAGEECYLRGLEVQKPQHTPGPWVAHGRAVFTADKRKHWIERRDRRAVYVAQVRARHDAEIGERCDDIEDNPVDEDEANANARLISAAPELLEALRYIVDYDGPTGSWDPDKARNMARAAIAKATGNGGSHDS